MVADSSEKKSDQDLTAQGLDALLARLDPDRDIAGEKYEEIRLKLTKYFEWEGCGFVDEHADEAINRVARAIQQGKEILDLRAYFFGVARLIHFEALRESEKQRRVLADLSRADLSRADLSRADLSMSGALGGGSVADPGPGPGTDQSQPALECLESCLEALPDAGRDLITRYYQGDQLAKIRNRRQLAETLGLASNALRNRALRLRSKLEACVVLCLKQRDELVDSATDKYERE